MIKVAVGLVFNANQEILIAKRPQDKHLGGFWEFPGGKGEAKETTLDALKRELKEEVGIDVLSAAPFMQIKHAYPEKKVLLDVWQVKQFQGIAEGLENQEIHWVQQHDLQNYPFPTANQAILRKLKVFF